ncbi:hypothetical protein ACFQ9Y_02700 [Peribacillus simplex]
MILGGLLVNSATLLVNLVFTRGFRDFTREFSRLTREFGVYS